MFSFFLKSTMDKGQETRQTDRKRKANSAYCGSKHSCKEGFSWWTSMMLGVESHEQQAVVTNASKSIKY